MKSKSPPQLRTSRNKESSMAQNDNTPQNEQPQANTETPAEAIPSLEEMLKASELKAQEHYDAWMYAKAEGENIRRRAAEDISKAQKFAVERFSNEMLAVKDSLEAGMAVQTDNIESFKSGMDLTLKQLSSVFEKFNIKEINPVGEKLDPHKHQAIGMVESEQEANTVVNVMQKGYSLNDRVLRPALVMVAKAKE
ncbi:nucleotide exchange factor GrpE [Sideroxydans sp. CL21]|uniref:nucleotide exchange factor GrpE n=1 Tax=Sideroxydans sp. CL21 TaxID=2600596 RepID=UPI0024BC3B4F|nr:nucleotide exchange factor GrpE [Sideroxydans sp. CL21]